MTLRLGAWAIPGRVLLLSALSAVVLVVPLAMGFLLGGVAAAICIGMGYVATVRAALALPPLSAVALTVPAAMTAAVAVGLRGQPLAAACFVALCCFLVAPANMLADGLMSGVPTVAAVLVAVPGEFDPAHTIGWMLAGGLVVVLLATRLRKPSPQAGIGSSRAWRHAVVMAVSVGVVTFVVAHWQLPHGYWIALTLTVVLSPYDDDTMRKSWERVLGTIGGVLLALLLASLLPVWATAVLLFGCLVLMLAYATQGDYVREIAFLTPSVVLIGSSGTALSLVAVERAAATILGALLAGGVALALARWESRHSDHLEVTE